MENIYFKRFVKVAAFLLLLSGVTDATYGQCTDPVFVDAGVDVHVCATGDVLLGGTIYGGDVTTGTWTTDGTGSFDDNRSMYAVYTPGPGDYGQTITITLTSDNPTAPCTAASDFLLVTIDNLLLASVNTTDTTICAGTPAVITGSLAGASTGLTWAIEAGNGTITTAPGPNGKVIVTYNSVASDGGTLVLLSCTPSGPATNLCPPQPEFVNISVDPVPVVNAGADISYCSGVAIQLNGTITNGASNGVWSGGIGTFANANALSTTYTPHPNETGTTVMLTLTSINGLNVCPAQSDDILVTVEDVLVDVGADINVCLDGGVIELTPLLIGGTGTGSWTGGLGTFSPDRNTPNVTYTPDETEGGTTVTLTFTTNPVPGCQAVSDALDIFIDRPPLVDAGPDQSACIDGGSVFLSGVVYEYASSGHWEGGAGTITVIGTDPTFVEYTPDPSEAGQTVIMTFISDNGSNVCLPGTDEMTITFEAGPVATVGPEQRVCNESTVSVSGTITFGTTGAWSTSGDGTFDNATSLSAVYTPGSNDRANGYVLLTLTPDPTNYCTPVAASIDVVINPAIVLSSSVTNVKCNGGNTGAIDLTAVGGSGPLAYLWSNTATTQDISTLTAGTYSVVVTDSTGCTKSGSYTTTEPSAVVSVVTAIPTDVLCRGALSGQIALTVAGGSGSYNYSWSNGATTEDLSGLAAGSYTVNISDANGGTQSGCLATSSVTINQPAAVVSLASTVTDILCNGGNTGAINLTPAGGSGSYTFLWSNGSTNEDISNLTVGSYTVNVSDANGGTQSGCLASATISVSQPSAVVSFTSSVTDVLCNGGNTGAINITPAGGSGSYTYSWSNTSSTEDLSAIVAGNYSVTVSDANGGTQSGCSASATITVGEPTALSVGSSAGFITCYGGTTSVTVTASGGTAPYTGDGVFNGISAGPYSYTVTDAHGCQATATGTANQRDQIVISSFTPVSGGTGTSVTISGSGFTGATGVLFNGVSATYTVNSDLQITAQVPAGATPGVITVNAGTCTGSSTTNFTPNIQVNVKVFLQGYYDGSGLMRSPLNVLGLNADLTVCDTVRIRLYSASNLTAPAYTYTGLLHKDGTLQAIFNGSALGNSYYITVVHKNHLQLWSGSPVSMSNTTNYDFTTAANKGYGSQMADLGDGSFAMYAGDFTDGATLGVQDGYVDDNDYAEIENQIPIGLAGTYEYGDFDGDGYVDSNDYGINENNVPVGLTIARPF